MWIPPLLPIFIIVALLFTHEAYLSEVELTFNHIKVDLSDLANLEDSSHPSLVEELLDELEPSLTVQLNLNPDNSYTPTIGTPTPSSPSTLTQLNYSPDTTSPPALSLSEFGIEFDRESARASLLFALEELTQSTDLLSSLQSLSLDSFLPKSQNIEIPVTFLLTDPPVSLPLTLHLEEPTLPEDAYIIFEEGEFRIQKETLGNTLIDGYEESIQQARQTLLDRLNGHNSITSPQHPTSTQTLIPLSLPIIKTPAITSTSPELLEELAMLEEKFNYEIVITGLKEDYIISPQTIRTWYNEELELDESKIRSLVSEINSTATTMGQARTFTNSHGETINLVAGDYGWWLNTDKTFLDILSAINNRTSTTEPTSNALTEEPTEPTSNTNQLLVPATFRQTANLWEPGNDFGNSYVEIDLTTQHLWYYKDGQLLLETPIVSGHPGRGYATPVGIYSLTYKARNATLRGPGYATPVSYWMPFNGNVGMHDATWQPTFGGTRYRTNGSHGCINMPLDKAQQLFNYLSSQHDAVIVY